MSYGVINMSRILDFNDSQSSATIPIIEGTVAFKNYVDEAAFIADVGGPFPGSVFYNSTLNVVQYYDSGASSWIVVASAKKVTGSRGTPVDVPVGGITPLGVQREAIYVQGDGGAIDITANPQIAAGSLVGDELILICVSDANTLTLEDGDGLSLNGSMLMVNNSVIKLEWDGSLWLEQSRRD